MQRSEHPDLSFGSTASALFAEACAHGQYGGDPAMSPVRPRRTRAPRGVRSGRGCLGKRRFADACLTGNEHNLSASAERTVKRTTQL